MHKLVGYCGPNYLNKNNNYVCDNHTLKFIVYIVLNLQLHVVIQYDEDPYVNLLYIIKIDIKIIIIINKKYRLNDIYLIKIFNNF